jgi:tyrosinase
MEFGGIKTQDQKDGTVPPPASLDDILVMLDLGDDIKVRDMMSTQQGLLCYKYL